MHVIKCHNYSKYSAEAFNCDLKSVSWECVFVHENVNDAWASFKDIFMEICDCHAPMVTKKVQGKYFPDCQQVNVCR